MRSLEEATKILQQVNIVRHLLSDDGTFPNNGRLPLLFYQSAVTIPESRIVKELLESNRWINSWEGGIYDYHHYHSTAHEVLVVISGTARIQLGGSGGITLPVERGDAIVIPAGVAHKCLDSEGGFRVIGAYPDGQTYDLLKGSEGERPQADINIRYVALPITDPLYGSEGPLVKDWGLPVS